MRSSTVVFAVGLLAAPLSLMSAPMVAAGPGSFFPGASAQPANSVNGRPLEDAPLPRVTPGGVAPVDRVGGAGSRTLDAGPTNATPFSNTPSGTLSSGGTQTALSDRVLTPAETTEVTPNLSR